MEKKKLLLVHHDASITDLLRRALEDDACVMVEHDPARVRAQVRDMDVDMILYDCDLPGTRGLEIFKWMKEERPEITILALTSLSEKKEVEALRAGADFVSEPEKGLDEAIFLTRAVLYGNPAPKDVAGVPLKSLYDIAKAGTLARRQRPFLSFSLCLSIARVHGDGGSLMLLDEGQHELRLIAAYGMDEGVRNSARKRLGEKIAGWVAEKKEGVILEGKLTADPRFSGFSTTSRKIVSAISVPLLSQGKGIGVMNVNAYPPSGGFTREDLAALTLLGQEIGDGLARVKELEMLEGERTGVLKDMARTLSDKINNPLTVIYIGLSEFLRQEGVGEGDGRREILEDCFAAAGRIREAVADLKKPWGKA